MKITEVQDCLAFYKKLKKTETELYKSSTERIFNSDDLNKFKTYRGQYSLYVLKVENNILSILLDQLEQLKGNFETGISNLEDAIANANHPTEILSVLGQVLGIIGKIVILAG